MTAAEALELIHGYAWAGRYVVTAHAVVRMRQRRVFERDLRRALCEASSCLEQPDERWRVVGPDWDGDELTMVVVIDDGLIVVTLF